MHSHDLHYRRTVGASESRLPTCSIVELFASSQFELGLSSRTYKVTGSRVESLSQQGPYEHRSSMEVILDNRIAGSCMGQPLLRCTMLKIWHLRATPPLPTMQLCLSGTAIVIVTCMGDHTTGLRPCQIYLLGGMGLVWGWSGGGAGGGVGKCPVL